MVARVLRILFPALLMAAAALGPSPGQAADPKPKPAVSKPTVAKPTVSKPKPIATAKPRKPAPVKASAARKTPSKARRSRAVAAAAAGAGAAAALAAPPALPRDADPELVGIEAKAREGDPESQVLMAEYFADQGPAALSRARYWYKRAADQGDADAAYALGELNRGGIMGRVDIDDAITWYGKAANSGHPDAMFDLGLIYAEGQGVPRDPVRAAQWFQDAADAGVARALFQLGALYELGVDGAPDLPAAAGWYREAARAGDITGKAALDRLAAGGRNFLDGDEALPGRAPGKARPVAVDQGAVKEIQTRLKALGYNVGRADGHLTKRTLAAIRAYQKSSGQAADGRASQALLEQLRSGSAKS